MKAEHRKELQTNLLADSLGRLVKAFKSGSNVIFYGILCLIVLAAGLYWGIPYFTSRATQKKSALWVKLDNANLPADLDQMSNDNPNTNQALLARFEKARTLMQRGENQLFSLKVALTDKSLESLSAAKMPEAVMTKVRDMKDKQYDDLESFKKKLAITPVPRDYIPAQLAVFEDSPLAKLLWSAAYFRTMPTKEELSNYQKQVVDQVSYVERTKAKEDMAQARGLYDALGEPPLDIPVLAQEALMGSATIRESLGDLVGAKEYYDKLVKRYSDSPNGKAAAAALANWDARVKRTD